MSKIFKYNKAIFACSAIVVTALSSFVQSASAGINSDGIIVPSIPVTINSNPGNPPVTINSNPGNPSDGNGPDGRRFSPGTGRGPNPSQIARGQALSNRISLAAGKYDVALAALAAAEAAQTNASSNREPVRFARQVADASACGCPNTDTASAGTPSKELVAAKAAEAEAAAELAAAKAEALQFLESVKDNSGANNVASFQPIW